MEQVHFIRHKLARLRLSQWLSTSGASFMPALTSHGCSRGSDYAAGFRSTAARLQYVTTQTRMPDPAGYLAWTTRWRCPSRAAYGKPALGLPYQGG